MTALHRPLTAWLVSLAVASAACSAWLLGYFLEERRWFLSHAELTTVGAQLSRAFAADSPFTLRLFLTSPWLAALLALSCLLLAWRLVRGSRAAALLGALSLLAVPAIYVVGIRVLRRVEDRIYFDRSPWVVQFRVGCAVLGAVAVGCVVWAALRARRQR